MFCYTTFKSQVVRTKLRDVKGFTLLEVLIALTIGSFIILVSTLSLRMGLSHLDSSEEWLNKSVQNATVFDFFWQQVSSIRPIEIPKSKSLLESFDESEANENEDGKANSETKITANNKIFFKGDIDSMSFISPLSLKNHYGYGLIIATYSQKSGADGYDLVYKEKRLNPTVLSSFSDIDFDVTEEIVFFKDCEEITFEYLKSVGGGADGGFEGTTPPLLQGGSTFQEWVSFLDNKLPRAIKILITKEEQTKELIAPIMVMYSL